MFHEHRWRFLYTIYQKVLFLKISISFPSLIPCLISPTDDRETTERTPTQLPVTKKCVLLRFPNIQMSFRGGYTHHGRARTSTETRDINLLLASLERSKLSQLIQREIGLDSLDFCPQGKEEINLLLAALERSKLSQLIQREIGLDSLDFLPRAKENIYHGSV